MKKILLGAFLILFNLSAYAAVVTYKYTGPDAQVIISTTLLQFANCEMGCSGKTEVQFEPEYYGHVDFFILLESAGSSLEFVLTSKLGKHYAVSNEIEKNIIKAGKFLTTRVTLEEIENNYLDN